MEEKIKANLGSCFLVENFARTLLLCTGLDQRYFKYFGIHLNLQILLRSAVEGTICTIFSSVDLHKILC